MRASETPGAAERLEFLSFCSPDSFVLKSATPQAEMMSQPTHCTATRLQIPEFLLS